MAFSYRFNHYGSEAAMKRTILSCATLAMLLATPVLLSSCATSETAARTNPAEMLAQQQMARRSLDMQSGSVDAAGRK